MQQPERRTRQRGHQHPGPEITAGINRVPAGEGAGGHDALDPQIQHTRPLADQLPQSAEHIRRRNPHRRGPERRRQQDVYGVHGRAALDGRKVSPQRHREHDRGRDSCAGNARAALESSSKGGRQEHSASVFSVPVSSVVITSFLLSAPPDPIPREHDRHHHGQQRGCHHHVGDIARHAGERLMASAPTNTPATKIAAAITPSGCRNASMATTIPA